MYVLEYNVVIIQLDVLGFRLWFKCKHHSPFEYFDNFELRAPFQRISLTLDNSSKKN